MSEAISETFVEIRAELDGLRQDLKKANTMISGIGKGAKFNKLTAIFTGITAALGVIGAAIHVVMAAAKLIAMPFKAAFWVIKKTAQAVIGTIKKIFSGLIGIASRVGAAIKSAFVAGKEYIKGAIDVAKDFSEQMSAVGALTSTTGTKDFGVLREKALELGKSTEFSATQAAMAMANFARTGQSVNEIMDSIGPTLNFATANFLDLNEASDIAARVMGGMGLSAEEAGRAMDALTVGANKSNQNVSDLGEAMKNVGASAKSSNMDLEQTVGTLMAFASAGRRGGEAGTALKQILLKMPTKQVKQLFDELNVSAKDATTGGFRPLADIIDDLGASMSGMDEFEKQAKLVKAFGTRAGPGLSILLDTGGSAIRKYTKTIRDNAGMALKNAEIQRKSFANSFKVVASAADDLRIRLVDVLEPIIVGANERAVQALNFLSGFVKTKGPQIRDSLVAAFRQAKDWIIEALTLVIGYADLSVEKIVGIWKSLSSGIESASGGLGKAISGFFGQDLLDSGVGPIERVVTALKVAFVKIKMGFGDVVNSLQKTLIIWTGRVQEAVNKVVNVLSPTQQQDEDLRIGRDTSAKMRFQAMANRNRRKEQSAELQKIIAEGNAAGGATSQNAKARGGAIVGGWERAIRRLSGEKILSFGEMGKSMWKQFQDVSKAPTLSFGEMGESFVKSLKEVFPEISKKAGELFGMKAGLKAGAGAGAGGREQASVAAGTIQTVFGSFKVSGDEQVVVLKEIAKSNEIIAKRAGGVVVKAFA